MKAQAAPMRQDDLEAVQELHAFRSHGGSRDCGGLCIRDALEVWCPVCGYAWLVHGPERQHPTETEARDRWGR